MKNKFCQCLIHFLRNGFYQEVQITGISAYQPLATLYPHLSNSRWMTSTVVAIPIFDCAVCYLHLQVARGHKALLSFFCVPIFISDGQKNTGSY
jgi:hypothetical protein